MKLEELLDKGLIKKQSVDRDEIRGSVSSAKHFLERAKGNQRMGFFDVAFLLAYNAMFHAARSLLFSRGYKERSHFAMVDALRVLYREDAKMQDRLNLLDSYRTTRHAVQYSGELSSELDAAQAIKDAEGFVGFVVSLLDNHKSKM